MNHPHPQAVLQAEAAALTLLAHEPVPNLEEACQALATATLEGLIVCTGLGKSGYVARRCAATLCSIGVPAAFLHPVEALHGDSGLLWAARALVCFSNSGATQEVVSLALQMAPIPIVSICRALSNLDHASTHCLAIPDLPEAGGEELPLPNVSICLQSALADALIMGVAGLVPQAARAFRLCHPGGSIGETTH